MATADQIRIIRVLIPDTELVFGAGENEALFSDGDITDFFSAGGNSVLRAAGLACLAIGTSEALISKKIRTQDLQTDGPAVAEAMRKKAELLFKRADDEQAVVDATYFDIINFGEGWLAEPELTEWATNVWP